MRGFESYSCQKTFWTRWGRAFSWQILSYWNANSRWQSKAKENKRLATSLGGWQPSSLKVNKKEDTRRRHVKHDSTRGFECKSFQIDDTNSLANYISELKKSLNWKDTDQKEICRRKPGRMAGRSKTPDARNYFFENGDTRVCPWVRSPVLSENISDVMRHKIQVTNSLILKYVWVQTQIRPGKFFEMYDDNSAVDYTSEFKKLKNEIAQFKSIMADEPQAGKTQLSNAPDCRTSSVETSGTQACAWVRIPLLSENILNTMRQSLQLTISVILERQFKMTVQSKRKQTTRNVIRGW